MAELDFKRIGKKIREKRLSMGYRQEYVADILNVNPSHISNIECGRSNPSLTILVKIADILQCSVDCFLNEEYTYPFHTDEDIEHRIKALIHSKSRETKEKLLKIIEIL